MTHSTWTDPAAAGYLPLTDQRLVLFPCDLLAIIEPDDTFAVFDVD